MGIEPRFRFEPTPIVQRDLPEGGRSTQLNDLAGRVIDSYFNMPMGTVIYGADGRFHARPSFPDHRAGESKAKEIERDWGARADLTAAAIWEQYWKQFSLRDRAPRILWRLQTPGWLVAGAIIGFFLRSI